MKIFESRYEELSALSKNWNTDQLFIAEARKLSDELQADATLCLTTGCDGAEIKERIRAFKGLITTQETWLWTQREALLDAQEIPRVQWVM
ncbi:MAG: hypothetical protein CVU51_02985 [Deltaproteobacteria bacterium HGW-Deltaproteobacteria-1]|jgi:hypothetical protein|nr:MAG: hypothetical protein CVU51_02985 [Deltaproteobacteria bacterium HGW-Deltaproteobacteria-1]